MPGDENRPDYYGGKCPKCMTGFLRLKYLAYFTWMEDQLISVPNFPAWVCDLCGYRENDARAIRWLQTLLNTDAQHQTHRQRPHHPGTGPLQP